eukprot:TRINITY_DN2536_c0_g2_i1.p1 TRINITY_DN2536_c0_g2~~TRINITY_DN2536_c0_g2_i1.p1  ORF type:complete len:2293 (-),score=494.09 TRINITY_DN2536_c0_g2_i1:306-7184(-)
MGKRRVIQEDDEDEDQAPHRADSKQSSQDLFTEPSVDKGTSSKQQNAHSFSLQHLVKQDNSKSSVDSLSDEGMEEGADVDFMEEFDEDQEINPYARTLPPQRSSAPSHTSRASKSLPTQRQQIADSSSSDSEQNFKQTSRNIQKKSQSSSKPNASNPQRGGAAKPLTKSRVYDDSEDDISEPEDEDSPSEESDDEDDDYMSSSKRKSRAAAKKNSKGGKGQPMSSKIVKQSQPPKQAATNQRKINSFLVEAKSNSKKPAPVKKPPPKYPQQDSSEQESSSPSSISSSDSSQASGSDSDSTGIKPSGKSRATSRPTRRKQPSNDGPSFKGKISGQSGPSKSVSVDPQLRAATFGLRNRKNVKYIESESGDDEQDFPSSSESSDESSDESSSQEAPQRPTRVQTTQKKAQPPKSQPTYKTSKTKRNQKQIESEESSSSSSVDESEDEDEEDDGEIDFRSAPTELASNSIERIICHREVDGSEKSEFFVKYKFKSFVHAGWVSEDVVLTEAQGRGRIMRYYKNLPRIALTSTPDEPIPPEFLEIERILLIKDIPVDADLTSIQANFIQAAGKNQMTFGVVHTKSLPNVGAGKRRIFLVKWRSLPYSDCTWEEESVVKDDVRIQEYLRFNKLPSASEMVTKPRPSPEKWTKASESPAYQNANQLREYQLEGFNWLTFCWFQRRNTILADEMGLGKTVQSLSILNYLFEEQKIKGPFLVIAPLSTISHWQREFERWTLINCICYYGNPISRKIIQDMELYYRDERGSIIPNIYKFNVLVTTFEIVLTDLSLFRKISWRYAVIDEGHRLKNRESKLLEAINSLQVEHKLLLTGTPIQNNVSELWNLLNFLDPENFSSSEEFMAAYGNLTESSTVEKLQEILRPYMLRRMKEHVEKSLIPKEETIIGIDLTPIQKKFYRMVYYRNGSILKAGAKGANAPSLMNIMMELRKLCNHPFIVNGLEQQILSENREKSPNELIISTSGKMVVLDKLLGKLKSENHKVLIFSQMARVLDLLEDYLQYRKYIYERIDGSIRGNDRQAAIDRFCRPNSDRFVFLISTKAGGFGINLTPADTVIIFDSDWNPQNDLQAQARCHRIGQTKLVKVYRLVTNKTYESYMLKRASKKLGLDKAILSNISNQDSTLVTEQLDKDEIDKLLRYGAYQLLDDEDDSAAYKFQDDDIDEILERSTTITAEEPAESVMSSHFAKASFEPSSAPVKPEDPSFWNSVLKGDESNDLIQYQPRQRKQVQRYGVKSDSEDYEDDSEEEPSEIQDPAIRDGNREWSRKEYMNFRRELMTYGYSRWTFFTASLGRGHSPGALHALANRILELCFSIVGDRFRNTSARFIYQLFSTASPAGVEETKEAANIPDEILYLPGKPFVPQEEPSDDERKASERAKNFLKRLDHLAILHYVTSSIPQPVSADVADSLIDISHLKGGTPLPVSWWGTLEDKHLLIGVHRHGYGNFDKILKDSTLCFPAALKEHTDQESLNSADQDIDAWPAMLAAYPWLKGGSLHARLKALIHALQTALDKKEEVLNQQRRLDERIQKQQKRNQEKEDKLRKKEERKLAIEEAPLPLSRKDKLAIQKTLGQRGMMLNSDGSYKFDEIHKLLRLEKKSLESVESYITEFLKQCQQVVDLSKSKEGKDEKPDTLKDSAKDDNKEDSKEDNGDAVSLGRATRILQTVQLMKDVHELSMNANLDRLIRNCKENSSSLPSWWQGNALSFDKTLIIGVAKHGFGEWGQLCRLEPFLSARQSRLQSAQKSKPKSQPKTIEDDPEEDDTEGQKTSENQFDFPSFPQERVLMKRLESLVKYAKYNQAAEARSSETRKEENSQPSKAGKQTSIDLFLKRKRTLSPDSDSNDSSDFQSPEVQLKKNRATVKAESPAVQTKAISQEDQVESQEKPKSQTQPPPASNQRKMPVVERDQDGRPILPITFGSMTLHNLGTIEYKRDMYHTDRYIYPIGYQCSKNYFSTQNAEERDNYLCEIIDGGLKPKFKITWCDGKQERIGENPTSVWTEVVKITSAIRSIDRKGSPSVSGPEYFGIAHATIQQLIQELPNARLCTKFKLFTDDRFASPKLPTASLPADTNSAPKKKPTKESTSKQGESKPATLSVNKKKAPEKAESTEPKSSAPKKGVFQFAYISDDADADAAESKATGDSTDNTDAMSDGENDGLADAHGTSAPAPLPHSKKAKDAPSKASTPPSVDDDAVAALPSIGTAQDSPTKGSATSPAQENNAGSSGPQKSQKGGSSKQKKIDSWRNRPDFEDDEDDGLTIVKKNPKVVVDKKRAGSSASGARDKY